MVSIKKRLAKLEQRQKAPTRAHRGLDGFYADIENGDDPLAEHYPKGADNEQH